MCYRKSIPGNEIIEKRFNVKNLGEPFQRRYHVSAFSHEKLPVITDENPHQITLMNWGLIPHWVKDTKQANDIQQKTANARAETIYEKPSFRYPAEKKHCLVVADGFYEWYEHLGRKYPYYIRLINHEPFAMAGLWDTWKNPETQETLHTYTIVTTTANTLMQTIHNTKKRMPVILPENIEHRWIDKNITREDAVQMLQPLDPTQLEAYTISKLITTQGKDQNVPEIITPYQYPGITPSYNNK